MPENIILKKGFLIKGKVQRVSFRATIKEIAKRYKLIGFTKNLDNYDEDVLVYCEGDKTAIDDFERDLKKVESECKKLITHEGEIRKKLQDLTSKLDEAVLSGKKDKSPEIVLILERKKTHLRELKHCESMRLAYHIEDITPVRNIEDYKEHIQPESYGKDFKIIRGKNESEERLDEGIDALNRLTYTTSDLHYDIIDTDFAILDTKYAALTQAIQEGFISFPESFAKAFEKTLDEKYGLKPKGRE